MKKSGVRVLLHILFLISFFFLFVKEGPLEISARMVKEFSSFIPEDLLMEEVWYGIYFNGALVGFSSTSLNVLSIEEGRGFRLENRVNLKLPVLGTSQKVFLVSQAWLGDDYRLKKAFLNLKASNYFMRARLKKIAKERFSLKVKSPSLNLDKEITLASEVISPFFSPLFLGRFPSGKNAVINFYDPFLDKRSKVILENQGELWLNIEGRKIKAKKIFINLEGLEGYAFVDERGTLLKEEFMGFTFLKEDIDTILGNFKPSTFSDLAYYFSIASSEIKNPYLLKSLTLMVEGLPENLDYKELRDFNQEVFPRKKGLVFKIKQIYPQKVEDIPLDTSGLEKFLREDKFVRFKNPRIKKIVKEVVGKEKNPFKIIRLFEAWINKNIKKTPTFSFSNSLDTLKIKQGDCSELSVLLVSFLRSIGIPSYVNIGLVYQEGRFFYHAWVSAFIGSWFDTDPSLEEVVASPLRIKLFKEFRNQFEVLKLLGKLRIEILDKEYREEKSESQFKNYG